MVFVGVMRMSFWTKFDSLQNWHSRLVDKAWLQPEQPTKFVLVLIVLSVFTASAMSWYVRHWQYEVWDQNPQIFSLDDGTQLFTTTDAPYFLGVAQSLKQHGNFSSFQEKRLYPTRRSHMRSNPIPSGYTDAPLLSVLISFLADENSPKSLLKAGNKLLPISIILTSLMVAFAFGVFGHWLAGTIAAAGSGLSSAFLTRSSAGRIDTDQLNLGFFYLITGLIILSAKTQSFRRSIVLTVISGLVMQLFFWWYPKPVFGWIFLISLCWLSFVYFRDIKRILFQGIILLCSSGLIFSGLGLGADNPYLNEFVTFKNFIFPNTHATITELRTVPLHEVLERISGSVFLGVLSCFCMLLWAIRYPALAVIFFPAAMFSLLNFVFGNRTIFYATPLFWFGLGWVSITLTRYVNHRFGLQNLGTLSLTVTMLVLFSGIWFVSPTSYVQGPTFDRKTISVFKNFNEIAKESNPVVLTWWDYGYTSMFFNGYPTVHDPGGQNKPTTFFVASSLLSSSQKDASSLIKDITLFGSSGTVKKQFEGQKPQPLDVEGRQPYLVLTKDMANWIPSISKLGNWDVRQGKPKPLLSVPSDYELNYEKLICTASKTPNAFVCNDIVFDTNSGQFGNHAILDGMVVSRDGRQLSGRKFNNSTSALMLHSEIGERGRSNMLIHRDLYFSVFHQLFHAGRHDEQYFELVYDDYPSVRVFKVK